MDNELTRDKKGLKDGEPSLKDLMEKMVGRVKNNHFVKENSNTLDQIKWMQQRPSIEDIQSLVAKASRESDLTSEERTLTKFLQEVANSFLEHESTIEETIGSNNVWKARSLWTTIVELGVSFLFLLSRLGEVEAEKGAIYNSKLVESAEG